MSNNPAKPEEKKEKSTPGKLVEMPKRPIRKINAEWIEQPATLREIPRR